MCATPPASHFISYPRRCWEKLGPPSSLEPQPDGWQLSDAEVQRLRGSNDPIALPEVEQVYRPLCRLLNLYITTSQALQSRRSRFLKTPHTPVPYILAVSGSVAVGKSTTSRLLQALLSRWPQHRRVAVLTTDGFLHPNATLLARGLMHRKGFPESYNLRALLHCLQQIKAGVPQVYAPLYSHHTYDIVPAAQVLIETPDVLIVEGLNVLQIGPPVEANAPRPRLFVSDFFDFSIYVDAPSAAIRQWYSARFAFFAAAARDDPTAFFHRFANLNPTELERYALAVWDEINAPNLQQNILPCRDRAQLILQKAANHAIMQVWLRH